MINSSLDHLSFFHEKNFSSTLPCAQKETSLQNLVRRLFSSLQYFFSNAWNRTIIGCVPLNESFIACKTKNVLQRIEKTLQETLVYHGPGIRLEAKSCADPIVHGFMNYLLKGGNFSWQWLNWRIFKAIFIRKDPSLLQSMKEEFQYTFEAAGKCFPLVGSQEELLFETFIGNCLALLPYCYPKVGEIFSIPQKINGEWRVCQYRVNPSIDLTPKGLLTPLKAFGLTSEKGPPLLTIIGTTYPAGDGFITSILSDFTPGMSVGHAPYLLGKTKIASWLNGKTGVRLYGMSLGGALCFQILRYHREKIEQANVYNPPGLYPWNWDKPFDREKVNIFTQENDLVPMMGMFPEGKGVSVYRIFGLNAEGCLSAHAKCYAGGVEVCIAKSSPDYENQRIIRKVLTIAHWLFSVAIGLFSIACVAILCLRARAIIAKRILIGC